MEGFQQALKFLRYPEARHLRHPRPSTQDDEEPRTCAATCACRTAEDGEHFKEINVTDAPAGQATSEAFENLCKAPSSRSASSNEMGYVRGRTRRSRSMTSCSASYGAGASSDELRGARSLLGLRRPRPCRLRRPVHPEGASRRQRRRSLTCACGSELVIESRARSLFQAAQAHLLAAASAPDPDVEPVLRGGATRSLRARARSSEESIVVLLDCSASMQAVETVGEDGEERFAPAMSS